MTTPIDDTQRELDRIRIAATVASATALIALAVLFIVWVKGSSELYQIPIGIAINLASTLLALLVGWVLVVKRVTALAGLQVKSEQQAADLVNVLKASVDSALREANSEHSKALTKVQSQITEMSSRISQNAPLSLGGVRWQTILQNAREIDFVVQGWDSWMEDNEASLRGFLLAGGVFHLYIYDPESDKNNFALAEMAARLNKTPRGVEQEIAGTVKGLLALQGSLPQEQREKNPVTIHYIRTVNWYFAARARGRSYPGGGSARDQVIFSIYSHKRASVKRLPAFVVYPDQDEDFDRWFDDELDHLRNSAPN